MNPTFREIKIIKIHGVKRKINYYLEISISNILQVLKQFIHILKYLQQKSQHQILTRLAYVQVIYAITEFT